MGINKNISWIAFCLAILITSCGSTSNLGQSPGVTVFDGPDHQIEPVDTSFTVDVDSGVVVIDTVVTYDTIVEVPWDHRMDTLVVGIIMPFSADSLSDVNYSFYKYHPDKEERYRLSKTVNQSLEFYEGLIHGFSEYSEEGVNIQLEVFDSRGNHTGLLEVLADPVLAECEVILGPIFNDHARLVADFARENDIIHMLPFSPSKSVGKDNVNHVKVNPTINVHVENIFGYLQDSSISANTMILHQRRSLELDLVNLFDACAHNSDELRFAYEKHEIDIDAQRKTLDVKDYLSEFRKNIVVIPSFDQAFIHDLLRRLFKASKDHDIQVVGLPTWTEYGNLRLEYLNDLGTIITANYHEDETDIRWQGLKEKFSEEYNIYVTPDAVIGYDIASYLCEFYQASGNNWGEMENFVFHGLHNQMHFRQNLTVDEDGTVHAGFWENRKLHVLKYHDYDMMRLR